MVTRQAVMAEPAIRAAMIAAKTSAPRACASAPIASAVTAAYRRFGARAAGAESPNSA